MELNVLFQIADITQKGIENRPLDHLALAKSPRVKIKRSMGMMASERPSVLATKYSTLVSKR